MSEDTVIAMEGELLEAFFDMTEKSCDVHDASQKLKRAKAAHKASVERYKAECKRTNDRKARERAND